MRNKLIAGVVAATLGLIALLTAMMPVQAAPEAGKEIKVLLVYSADSLKKSEYVMNAYESVLQEEGVSYRIVDVTELLANKPVDVVNASPAIIFPDAVLQTVPARFGEWTRSFLESGGNIAIVYDPGIKDNNGFYLKQAVLTDILGLNYINYVSQGTAAYTTGSIQFVSQQALDFFQIPRGKAINQFTISGYQVGALQYPIARTEGKEKLPEGTIFANAVIKGGETTPAIVLRDFAKGKILYVNMPLGHIKASEDDLPLRAFMRTFLFDVVQLPHVLNVARGLGGVVINWHVDSVVEYDTLPVMKKMRFLRKGINASIHITAGPDFIKIGDNEGFDACGMGKPLTRMLAEYGTMGSHGGWAHNWFADMIRSGAFKEKEIQEYMDKNSKCIESVAGGKIKEYSAPVGVHPQPDATNALQNLGIVAYYYTGDMGSAPNRAFSGGKKITDKVIAFPVSPYEKSASFYEMHALAKKTDAEVETWLLDSLDYVSRHRTIRLVYSHPRDIGYYQTAITKFFDQAELMQEQKKLRVQSMTEVATFLLRVLKTTTAFTESSSQLTVSLKNPENLNDITVAIPKVRYGKPVWEAQYLQEDDRYYYLTIGGGNEIEKTIAVPRR